MTPHKNTSLEYRFEKASGEDWTAVERRDLIEAMVTAVTVCGQDVYREAIKELYPTSDEGKLGINSPFRVSCPSPIGRYMNVTIKTKSDEIIDKWILQKAKGKQGDAGKISEYLIDKVLSLLQPDKKIRDRVNQEVSNEMLAEMVDRIACLVYDEILGNLSLAMAPIIDSQKQQHNHLVSVFAGNGKPGSWSGVDAKPRPTRSP